MAKPEPPRPTTALVLSGGGARGAYEAGALLYMLNELPKTRAPAPGFDVFAGTSAGALNACALAAMAEDPARSARRLVRFWRRITMERVLKFGLREFASIYKLLFGIRLDWDVVRRLVKRPPAIPHQPVAGIFNTDNLHAELQSAIDWEQLQRNLVSGCVRGVALCATEVCTGRSVIFYQAGGEHRYHEAPHVFKDARAVRVGLDHAMASAAIPFLFASRQIDNVCYVDGGLHQNTPVHPAIRFGARKIMVISMGLEPEVLHRTARIGCRNNPYPGALFLVDRMLTALLTETLDHELQRMEMFNRIIERGVATFGDTFTAELDEASEGFRRTDWRVIRPCLLRPSMELNDLAIEALKEKPEELRLPGPQGRLLRGIMASSSFAASGILSYLMFTPTYIRKLIDLGYADAERHHDEVCAFFEETV